MRSKLDITKLRSATIYEGADEVARFFHDQRSDIEQRRDDSTLIFNDDDGRTRCDKIGGDSVVRNADLSSADFQSLAEAVGIKWEEGFEERVVPYWASDERVDRHGDIVRQNWLFENFQKNPVMPYSHGWELPPIGNVISWEVMGRDDDDYQGPALQLLNLFATAEHWEFADTIFRLVDSGFLKASSVGFYPGVVIDVQDEKEREELGLGRWGLIFDANELIEHSPTTVPANAGAISLLRSSGGNLQPHDICAIRDMSRMSIHRKGGDKAEWMRLDATLRSTWSHLFPTVVVPRHVDLDEPITLDTSGSQLSDLAAASLEMQKQLKQLNTTIEELVSRYDDKEDSETSGLPSPSDGGVLAHIDPKVVDRANQAAASLGR